MNCDCSAGFDANGSFIVVSSRKVNGFLLISTLAARFASFQAEEVRLVCRSQRERQTLRRFEWKDQWISVGLDVDGLGLFSAPVGIDLPSASGAKAYRFERLPTRTMEQPADTHRFTPQVTAGNSRMTGWS